jgi:hypothetical protein
VIESTSSTHCGRNGIFRLNEHPHLIVDIADNLRTCELIWFVEKNCIICNQACETCFVHLFQLRYYNNYAFEFSVCYFDNTISLLSYILM